MRPRLPWILLALSAVLNVGFVVGALAMAGHLHRLSTPAGRAAWAGDHLHLTAAERRVYDDESAKWLATVAEAEARLKPEQQAFWAEMVRDGSDLAEARRRFAPLVAHQERMMDEGLAYLHGIMQGMSVDKRRELARLLAERR